MTRRTWSAPVACLAFLSCAVMMPAAPVSAQPAAPQAAGRMIRPNHLIHVVADVEKSLAFYRDAVGLDLVAAPAPLTASALVQQARRSSPGATARAATLRIPGSK